VADLTISANPKKEKSTLPVIFSLVAVAILTSTALFVQAQESISDRIDWS
jgi:hypothetical protein